ncbi:cold shock domain-containing protein [Flavobacterium sp. NRK F10]|uniref:cold shock domain-containing protein n=1 Tax=Flavobacterium sp. NRK F10 TaxID=2954931 RepID=UPI0020916565|nr:cold shock domain-containing protein [Flavobacterium sp. NRK F10]MCO6173478.1 cold shock domain-containing protein [Flavobacterium sp. NRK F10]
MKTGIIKSFNKRKNIGFILSDLDGKEIFFHKSAVDKPVEINSKVSYEESENHKGKIAINITIDSNGESSLKATTKSKIASSVEIIQSIASNWKLEAKLESQNNYFYHLQEVTQILDNNKYYIIGRKGSGKSSISEHIFGLKNHDTFTEKLSFKNFPFNELYGLDNQKYTAPNQYITLWKYLIYSTVARLMVMNEKIDSNVRSKLKEIYQPDPIRSLARTINNWTSAEFGATVLGTGGTFKFSKDVKTQTNNWIDRVNALEDIILEYCDDSKYFIIFDELDEDYRSIKSDEYSQYNYLLTSLFKAVQDIKYTFNTTSINICPLVFLRDDIYSLIRDSDKNKWRDFKIEIEWNSEKIRKLIAYRISKDANYNCVLDFDKAWNLIFVNNQIKAGNRQTVSVNTFDYITRSTHLRPRDFIRYFQACCEETLNRQKEKISNDTVKFVDRAFSNYLRDEIIDELTPLLPDIEEILQVISNLRKQAFSIDEFKSEYNKYLQNRTITEENIDYVLDILFKFSVLGNQNKKRLDILYFKYMQTNMNLNRDEHLIVHRGLFKALQII